MPVICPTCQIFSATEIFSPTLLFKALHRRRCRLSVHNLFRIGDRRCRDPRGGLLLRCGAGLCNPPCPRSRIGSPDAPGMRDRGSCGKSNDRAGHRADGSQHNRARHRSQGSISGTTLSPCFERQKQSSDYRRNKQFFHCGSLRLRPSARDCRIAAAGRTDGVAIASQPAVQIKKPATGFPMRAEFLGGYGYAGDLPDVSNHLAALAFLTA
jgi:hypothetical protein